MTEKKISSLLEASVPSDPRPALARDISTETVPAELLAQDLELQIIALRKATAAMQQDLLRKNARLNDEIARLSQSEGLSNSAGPGDSAPVDGAAFFAALADIETRIGRHLSKFSADSTKTQIEDLRARVLAATPEEAAWELPGKSWSALTHLLLRSLLTETGKVVSPIARKRLRHARAQMEASGLFDKDWYLERNPDVAEQGMDPLEHYLRFGAREERLPAPCFLPPVPAPVQEIFHKPQTLAEVLESPEVYPAATLEAARADALSRASGPRISVVVPTYNRATTIVRAVRSALEQSLPPFEVIVADDQSTDRTLELLKEAFAEALSEGRLVLLSCKKGGVCKMRNAALERATGTVIAYLDSDNFWHPDHLLWAVGALQAGEAQSVYTAANIHHLTEHWSRVDSTPYDRRQMLAQNFIDLNCFVHRATLYKHHGGFDTSLTRLVDWEYILRLTKDAVPLRVPVTTVEYFLDKGGLANISFVSSLEENAIKIQIRHRDEMRAHGILNKNAEKRLDDAIAAMAIPARAAHTPPPDTRQPVSVPVAQEPMPTRAIPDPENAPRARPYFGSLNLFVVLPEGVAPPSDLPVDFVNPRWITVHSDGSWRERRSNGTHGSPHNRLPSGNYWCPDLRQPMPTPHQLATLAAATQLTMIDLAVGSFSLEAPPAVGVTCMRNQMVLRETAVAEFLAGRPPAKRLRGKVLRLLQGDGANIPMRNLATLLGCPVNFGKDGQTFGFDTAPDPVAMRPQRRPVQLAHAKGRPRVFVLAQKLAVGGVERNTIEIARQLRDSHECIYLTLEKIHSEQGSLCHQATEACAQVLDLAEIAHHGIYQQLLTHLNAVYAPDALWICNGSMWLAANAPRLRDIFARCGIVDQQVYDVDAGWINRYQEKGIQSFDRFIAINRKIHEKFIAEFKMDPDRIDLIYSAINAQRFRDARAANLDRFTQRDTFDLPQDKKLVVFMGRLVEQKRPLDFLEVARLSADKTDLHFVLVGNGVLAPEIEAFLGTHKPANVSWIKNVADTTQFWPAVDAYMVTSEYEGLPIALIEAISLGVPVVATDVGDIRYVLEKYAAGRVVDKIGDPVGFARTLHDFVPDLTKAAAALQNKGGEIIDFFSAETISDQFAASFEKAHARATKDKS